MQMTKCKKFAKKKKKRIYLCFFNIMMKNSAFYNKCILLAYLIVYLQTYF